MTSYLQIKRRKYQHSLMTRQRSVTRRESSSTRLPMMTMADCHFTCRHSKSLNHPLLGEVEYDPVTGLIVYRIPASHGSDVDTFTYRIANEQGIFGEPAVVEVTIAGAGRAPVAIDDFVLTRENQAVVFNPLVNDIDEGELKLENLRIVSGPASGNVTSADAGLRYQPNTDFTGSDSLVYAITNEQGFESEALVEITVGEALDPPAVPGQPLSLLQRADINDDLSISALERVADDQLPQPTRSLRQGCCPEQRR